MQAEQKKSRQNMKFNLYNYEAVKLKTLATYH